MDSPVGLDGCSSVVLSGIRGLTSLIISLRILSSSAFVFGAFLPKAPNSSRLPALRSSFARRDEFDLLDSTEAGRDFGDNEGVSTAAVPGADEGLDFSTPAPPFCEVAEVFSM